MKWKTMVAATTMMTLIGASLGCSTDIESKNNENHPPGGTALPQEQSADASQSGTLTDGWWTPELDQTWQVQLSSGLDASVLADIYDVDGVDTPQRDLDTAKDRGAHLVCYVNGGAWEEWRADAAQFPRDILGNDMEGWQGEKWLDIRDLDSLLPIMAARVENCATRGFDAVDFDNVDGYDNDTGFPLTEQDQLTYIRALIELTHDRGLGFGLKNSVDLVGELADEVDFAVNEQCNEYNECSVYDQMIARGKPVVVIEYPAELNANSRPKVLAQICENVPPGIHVLLKDLDLGAATQRC